MGTKSGLRKPLLEGERWGRLTWDGSPAHLKGAVYFANLICACGQSSSASLANLRSGKVRSCGCLRSETTRDRSLAHGMCKTRTYRIWAQMKTRCDNPEYKEFAYYGGRGITYAKKWRTFEGFLADMGEAPDSLTLERKNVNKSYGRGNCTWATQQVQSRNRRNSLWYEWRGERRHLKEWCEIHALDYHCVYDRLFAAGWTFERAMTTPSRRAT